MGQENLLCFIHGWPLNHEMWEYQLNELSNITPAVLPMTEEVGKSDALGKL
jgi:pimeloyl-ACP methyl ester carboxylesterase